MENQVTFFDGQKQFKIDKPVRLIELFAGIGSQAKALKNLGVDFEHYRICEFDKYAVASYNAVHGTNFTISDITKITADDLGIVDTDKYCYIMTYSFPCQDLSNAGLGKGMAKGSGTRSGLLWEVERLLDECKELPQVLLTENVPQVIGQKNIEHFAKWQEKLESLGYKNKWQLLNAKDFGIPQNRERCFMVSVLGDYYYEFPKKIKLEKRLKDLLEKDVAEKYFLSNKMIKYISASNDKYTGNNNSAVINREIGVTVNTRVGSTRADCSDYICDDLPNNFDIKLTTNCGNDAIGNGVKIIEPLPYDEQNNRIRKDGFVGTLTTDGSSPKHNNRVIVDYRIRKLTPKECWRLMGFEDCDIDKAIAVGISNAQLYKQAGNSIVVNVLVEIFKKLLNNA
jgi:DNA (cytosine-5)-methyltransferase 1